MTPVSESAVSEVIRFPVAPATPVASVQGTLALDLGPRLDVPEPDLSGGPAAGLDVVSSVATDRSRSSCAGRRRRSTRTSPAGRTWWPPPWDGARAPEGSSRSAPTWSRPTRASCPRVAQRSACTSGTGSAPAR